MPAAEIRVDPGNWARVVSDVDGYQVVVAGPGTGKTELLVHRVEHLVRNDLARREEIVALCFSRRASADLRQRIETAIGPAGVPVDTTTFHSLALRLMEASADGDRPIPLTTPEQVGLVAQILRDEDQEDWPLPYRGILSTSAFATEAADFLMRCSERLLTPEDLESRAAMRSDWRGLPGLYRRYLRRLETTGRTDYGVLLVSAANLLGTPAGQELAKRYRYVLVDEYQDTSPVQAEIAKLLARSHGNLTVTGDPYQSIYSFRGAELRNVAEFTVEHPDATRYVLSQSFRVPEAILDSALRVVFPGHLPGAAGQVEPAKHEGRCEAYVFDQETAEAEWIGRQVEEAIRIDAVAPSSIAVLVRSKRELLNELSRALSRRGIPHDPPASRLVDHPAVGLFHDLVTVATRGTGLPADNPVASAEADRAMRRILLGPLVGLNLGLERSLLRRRRRTWASWPDVLEENVDLPGLTGLLRDPSWATDPPVTDGFWLAWSTLDGIDGLVEEPSREEWRRALFAFGQVLARQAERDPSMSLARFFQLTEEEDFEATPLISHRLADDRVTLTTLHQAKGLEFDLVFIANAVEGVFPDLRRSRRMLRPELLSPDRTTDVSAQHLFQLQEEMRLAYTAMTRARLRVVWTATDAGVDQGEQRPSRFLVAAAAAETLAALSPPAETDREPITLSEAEISMRRQLMTPQAPAHVRLAAAQILADPPAPWWDASAFPGVPLRGEDAPILPGTISLSPSQADSYRACPRRYALERRLRLGDAASPYAQFGSLIHSALEAAEAEIVGTGRRHAEVSRVRECIDQEWLSADFGTPELNEAWRTKAHELATKLYENWPSADATPIDVERRVEESIEGVPWIGIIDRVEETPAGVRVVDYKTSTTPMTKAEAARSLQLAFYALALEKEDQTVVEAELWYPRARTKSVSTRALDMSLLEDLETEMRHVTTSILGEDWTPIGGDHCGTCSFRLSCPVWPEGKGAFLV